MREGRMSTVVAVALWGVASLAAIGCGESKVKEAGIKVGDLTHRATDSVGGVSDLKSKVEEVTGPVSFKDAEAAYDEKEYDEAVKLFKGYTTQKSENPWGHYMLGLSAWKARDLDLAEGEFLRALELDPTHVKSIYNLARVYLDKGESDRAVEQIESALKLDSTSSQGFRLLGRTRDELGLLVEAEEAYRQALKLDAHDAWSMNNLGLNFIKQDRADEAISVLARATEIKPENAQFQNNLGMALELNGHLGKASEVYQKAVGLDSSYQKAIDNLARVSGREDKAGLPEIDLKVLAQNFAGEIEGSKVSQN